MAILLNFAFGAAFGLGYTQLTRWTRLKIQKATFIGKDMTGPIAGFALFLTAILIYWQLSDLIPQALYEYGALKLPFQSGDATGLIAGILWNVKRDYFGGDDDDDGEPMEDEEAIYWKQRAQQTT